MEIHYQEFDNIMEHYQEAKKYTLDNADYFANKKAEKTTYSTPSLLLGLHTPSLLLNIGYSGAYKKGRKLTSPGNRPDYFSYEYDIDGNLIRITDHGDSSKFFCCIFGQNGFEWAIPIYRYKDHYCAYPYYSHATKWDNTGRVSTFIRINNAEMWIEEYTYPLELQSVAICKKWYYVPNLSHTSKDKSITETGSPAQLWVYKLDITNPKKITGKMIESYEYDVSAYRQNPPVLPAPQIHTKISD